LKQQFTQPGFYRRFGYIQWRTLGRVVFFALLLTQQAWAGLFCCCEPVPETQPVAVKSTHHSCHIDVEEAAPTNKEQANSQSASSRVLICCAMPQAEAERVTLLAPNQTPIPNALPPLLCQMPVIKAARVSSATPIPLQRPLYLALSCWLI
jgi:hypothetical protein